jgi:hypothetical protein
MRRLRDAFLAVALFATAALAAPMGNDDVVRMVRGGLADATVIQAIDAAEPALVRDIPQGVANRRALR